MQSEKPPSTILVIDDSEDYLILSRTLLTLEGYEVMTASNASAALEILEKAPKPDLILLDVNLLEMTGPEFLLILEEKKPHVLETTPVVFVTAGECPRGTKARGFIKKGLDIDDFLEEIKKYLNGS